METCNDICLNCKFIETFDTKKYIFYEYIGQFCTIYCSDNSGTSYCGKLFKKPNTDSYIMLWRYNASFRCTELVKEFNCNSSALQKELRKQLAI